MQSFHRTCWLNGAFPVTQTVKNLLTMPGEPGIDPGSASGLGSSSGEGNGKPLQSSWLENSMDRGA